MRRVAYPIVVIALCAAAMIADPSDAQVAAPGPLTPSAEKPLCGAAGLIHEPQLAIECQLAKEGKWEELLIRLERTSQNKNASELGALRAAALFGITQLWSGNRELAQLALEKPEQVDLIAWVKRVKRDAEQALKKTYDDATRAAYQRGIETANVACASANSERLKAKYNEGYASGVSTCKHEVGSGGGEDMAPPESER